MTVQSQGRPREMKDHTVGQNSAWRLRYDLPKRPALVPAPLDPLTHSSPLLGPQLGSPRRFSSQREMQPAQATSVCNPEHNHEYQIYDPSRTSKCPGTTTAGQPGSYRNALRPEAPSQFSLLQLRPPCSSVQRGHIAKSTSSIQDVFNFALANRQNSGRTAGALEPPQANKMMEPVASPPAPSPTKLYLIQSCLPVLQCAAPKRLLAILDLNGTLVARLKKSHPCKFIARPGVYQLLDYLFQNHVVMVYSSAQPSNVSTMVKALFGTKRSQSMAAIWTREDLDLTPAQFASKVQVYKNLEKVWADESIQATCSNRSRWGQDNTVLVDDSHLKALSQPHNLIQVPEFITAKKKMTLSERQRERQIFASVQARLEELKWTQDVSRLIRRWQTGQTGPPVGSQLGPLRASASASASAPATDGDNDIKNENDAAAAAADLETNMEDLSINLPRIEGLH